MIESLGVGWYGKRFGQYWFSSRQHRWPAKSPSMRRWTLDHSANDVPRPLTCATHAAKPPIETYRKAKTCWSYLDFQVFYHHISWFLYMFLFGTWDPWRCSKLSGHVRTARSRPRWSPGTRVATMPSLESWKQGLVPQFCATESSSKHLRVENRYLGILPAVASASPCHFRFFEQSVHEKHATPGTSMTTPALKPFRKHLSYLVLQKFHEISTICLIFSSFVTGCNWPRFAFERFLMVFLTLISLGGTLLSSDYGTSGVVPVKSKAWPMPFKVLVQRLDSSTRRLDTKWSSSPHVIKSTTK